jgi:hypothetical protein
MGGPTGPCWFPNNRSTIALLSVPNSFYDYSYYPYAFYPQNELNGLGRVQPVQPVQQPRGTINGLGRVPNKDTNQEMLFFTLGRIMGQLKKNNNETNNNAIVERLFGNQQGPVGPPIHPSAVSPYTWPTTLYNPWPTVNPWFVSPNGHFLQQQQQQQRQSSALRPSYSWLNLLFPPLFQESSKQARNTND